MILGVIFSWGLAFAAIWAALLALFPSVQGVSAQVAVLAAGLLAYPAPALWLRVMNQLPYAEADRCNPFRKGRLATCLASTGASPRFAHRLIEQLYRAGPVRKKQLLGVLQQLPVGCLVFANLDRGKRVPRPVANAIPFEPVDIQRDVEGLTWLCLMNLEQQHVIDPPSQSQSPVPQPAVVREELSALAGAFRRHWGILLWLPLMYMSWRTRQTLTLALPIALFVVWAFGIWVYPLFRERCWWLVPGGLICSEFRLWRRHSEIKLFTAADTPLFLDAQTGRGSLLDHGHIIFFPCPAAISWIVAAGWISNAQTPSLGEVRAFLGQP